MKTLNLAIGVHCHQPVGNFDKVMEKAYSSSYLPFLKKIAEFPSVKINLHYSGCLLEWLEYHHPEFFGIVRGLVERRQAEVFGGGFYEPILSVIPKRDRAAHLEMMQEYAAENLGMRPRGAWLTERIWEPGLPVDLAAAGIEYVAVDDYHFVVNGFDEKELRGYFVTEDSGSAVAVFPISEKLRYLVPFREPAETIGYLAANASEWGGRLLTIFDDGEKFGLWPGTKKWVYKDGWLDRFLTSIVENGEMVRTVLLSEYFDEFPARGRAYLPTTSYFEMSQWALPAEHGRRIAGLAARAGKGEFGADIKPFLQGGFWRNFLVKYPESNLMHKKQLLVSNMVDALAKRKGSDDPAVAAARRELMRGQCNCAYWHGVFGGLYMPYLRNSVYYHLLAAEKIVDAETHGDAHGDADWIDAEAYDYDADGEPEVLVRTRRTNWYIKPSAGGALVELDVKRANINLLNTMARRREAYHYQPADEGQKALGYDAGAAGGASIHDLEKRIGRAGGAIKFDWHNRHSFIDHFPAMETSLSLFKDCAYADEGDFVLEPYRFELEKTASGCRLALSRDGSVTRENRKSGVNVAKTFIVETGDPDKIVAEYRVTNASDGPLELFFGVEFNFATGSSDDNRIVYRVGNTPGADALDGRTMSAAGELPGAKGISIVDGMRGMVASVESAQAGAIWVFPVETLSQSESGFDRVYQSSAVFVGWRFELAPGAAWENRLVLSSRDTE